MAPPVSIDSAHDPVCDGIVDVCAISSVVCSSDAIEPEESNDPFYRVIAGEQFEIALYAIGPKICNGKSWDDHALFASKWCLTVPAKPLVNFLILHQFKTPSAFWFR